MNYVIYGIHCKSKCFGYFVMVYDRGEFNDTFTQVYLMEISRIMDAVNMNREIVGLKEIRELYLKDPLTGIYNRRGFDKQLRALESEKKLDHKYLSIVSIDMDGLKYINDKFGHAEGDVALCRLAHMLEELLTEDEVCARVGGDEYVALLVAGDEKRGLSFAASFAQRMEQEFQEEKMPYPFRASIGVYPVENIMELMESMRKADEEMYKNKREHKAGIGIR